MKKTLEVLSISFSIILGLVGLFMIFLAVFGYEMTITFDGMMPTGFYLHINYLNWTVSI